MQLCLVLYMFYVAVMCDGGCVVNVLLFVGVSLCVFIWSEIVHVCICVLFTSINAVQRFCGLFIGVYTLFYFELNYLW